MHLRKKIVPFSASFYFCNSRFGAQRKLIVSSFRTPNQDTQLVKLIEIERKIQTLAILRVGISIEIILSFYNFIHSFITSFFIHSLLVSVLVFCLRWNSLGDLREDTQNSLFLTSRTRTARSPTAAHSLLTLPVLPLLFNSAFDRRRAFQIAFLDST